MARCVAMRELRLTVVPYELGRRGEGVGAGPERLLAEGAEAALGDAGGSVSIELVELDARFGGTGYGDVDAGFELIRVVGRHVAAARAGGALPVLLSGSCFVAVGVVTGLGSPPPAVAWFDAHSDFNTPQTSLEGYFDGMGLAVLTGGAWQGMLASVPDATPLAEQSVVLTGARDLEPPVRQRLASSSIRCVTAEQLRDPAVLLRTLEESPTPDLVELTRRQLEAVNRRDMDEVMSRCPPDGVYDTGPDGLGVYEGPAAIRAFLGEWWDAFEELAFEPEDVLDLGHGFVLLVVRQKARLANSTGRLQRREAYVLEWVEDMIRRLTVYTDIDEARAAAERLAEERE